jgi:hypothetical protein
MDGKIGKYPIHVTLIEQKDGMIRGAYYYKKGSAILYLFGERNGKYAELNEYTLEGSNTGYWTGVLSEKEYSGIFKAVAKGKSYTFSITPTDKLKPVEFKTVNFDDFLYMRRYRAVESGNLSGLLDKYEKYVDDYIALMKKARNGNVSALEDASSLMEKALELAEELEKEQGDMSVSEAKRMAAIYEKMIIVSESMQDF